MVILGSWLCVLGLECWRRIVERSRFLGDDILWRTLFYITFTLVEDNECIRFDGWVNCDRRRRAFVGWDRGGGRGDILITHDQLIIVSRGRERGDDGAFFFFSFHENSHM